MTEPASLQPRKPNGKTELVLATIRLVPKWEIASIWPTLQFHLDEEPELWNFIHRQESIRQLLEAGHSQLWTIGEQGKPAEDCWIMLMTEVWTSDADHKTLTVWWARGRQLEAAFPYIAKALGAFARRQGCDTVTVVGRLGWTRYLEGHGFKHFRTEMMLDLQESEL